MHAPAQSAAFTYQGQLKDYGNPANGSYDLSFTLHNAASGGSPVGSIVYVDDKAVANGIFSAELEFGSQTFVYSGRVDFWIEIGVRAGSVSNSDRTGYTALSPRQKVTPTPYSLHAQNAQMLNGMTDIDFMASTTDNWVNTTGDSMTGALNILTRPRNRLLFRSELRINPYVEAQEEKNLFDRINRIDRLKTRPGEIRRRYFAHIGNCGTGDTYLMALLIKANPRFI